MTTEPLLTDTSTPESFSRRIRSFIRREGRLTVAQTRALAELMPRFGLAAQGPIIDQSALFGRTAPLTLEIGFGNGESLLDMAQAAPDQDFIGIEVHRPGVGHLLLGIEQRGLTNIRVMNDDAVPFIQQRIGPAQLDRLLLYFPDPWHKARHHKRRIVQPDFADLIAERLKPGGIWHLATDWANYAEHMRDVLDAHAAFTSLHQGTGVAARPDWRPETKFERRGIRLGHEVFDLVYRRKETA
ncbi:tRNA (guanosine(46)-N7)-methyltransferase TrmB [Halothiobacillus diazotrophicus]|uniref:tRNA (guanine-N(7)-)-methyltransferase n=1 Tax=Halothiobacillus diazotrophicus TaxID=1860122 RepID=A0A191ZGC2_9GAMM|nr:tRNA (guanosine(46)-N7)-methyltransferase TrmB [Halothiobacillus diazotrophicus]ANJ66902.1 tRNA (guanosine(46)-N7)-methyltransferase TrmB [Halothiobacillus diazotrophicus]